MQIPDFGQSQSISTRQSVKQRHIDCDLPHIMKENAQKRDINKQMYLDMKAKPTRWVAVSDEEYERFLEKLKTCAKAKHFKATILDKHGVKALVLYDTDKKVFYEKCTGREVHRLQIAPGCEVTWYSEAACALLEEGQPRFQEVLEQTMQMSMMHARDAKQQNL